MKHMRKLLAMALAVLLVMSLATTALADEATCSITAPENGRSYDVYQIFTGDYDAVSGKLSNIVWGENGTGDKDDAVEEDVLTELASVNGTDATDADKLAVITKYVNWDSQAHKKVTSGDTVYVVPGYYLIKDNGPVEDGSSYSLYVVKVASNIIISPKVGKVISDKAVKDTNDSTGEITDWQGSADYDVGDAVPFRLTATLPEDYDLYTKGYKLTFHDTLSSGLTFNEESVVVKIGDTVLTKDTDYAIEKPGTEEEDACTFEIKFANLKNIEAAVAGSIITVEYTATLNKNAVAGVVGNPNTSNVTYTNNPNDAQAGENGSTPDDTVIVFTYNVIVNKVDKDGAELAGAGFTLYKYDADATTEDKWIAVGDEITGATTFEFKKLDEGKYKLVETTVPAGYNKAADVEFEIVSEFEGTTLKSLTVTSEAEFTVTLESGNINANVVNYAGSTLPETGGMGTTLFYVFGSIMVLAAAILLITKKRMTIA